MEPIIDVADEIFPSIHGRRADEPHERIGRSEGAYQRRLCRLDLRLCVLVLERPADVLLQPEADVGGVVRVGGVLDIHLLCVPTCYRVQPQDDRV